MKNEYIPDTKIDLSDEEDILKTKPYVDTLEKLIKEVQTPFTIGLFGRWGSGKSSIIHTLENRLKDDKKNNIEFFVYDAWKYSNDPFRRTFLINFAKKFNLDTKEYLEKFYKDTQEDTNMEKRLNKKGVAIAVMIPIFFFVISYFVFSLQSSDASKISYIAALAMLFSIIEFGVTNAFSEYKTTVNYSKLFSPEQFEEYFNMNLKKVTGKDKKLVIVIDNIDRCDKKTVPELLSTIKNFMEKEGVIFLIPLDNEALEKYLKESEYEKKEFLRKIFNVTIVIKKFSEEDLFDFAKSLNEKYTMGFSDEILSIISQEFSESPRKIIQFMNILKLEIELAKKQEERGNIAKGAITENIPMLTKIIIIREGMPELYNLIKKKSYYLYEINKSLDKHGNPRNVDNKEDPEFKKVVEKLKEEDIRFLMRTKHIHSENIELFLSIKDSFPGVPDEVFGFVNSQDWESLKRMLENKALLMEDLLNFISHRLKEDVSKRKLWGTSGVNILSLVFKISSDEDFGEEFWTTFDKKRTNMIPAIVGDPKIKEIISNFDPLELVNFAAALRERKMTSLEERIAEAIAGNGYSEDNKELIKSFVKAFKEDEDLLNNLRDPFSLMISSNPEEYDEFRNLLIEEGLMPHIINKAIMNEMIKNMDVDYEKNYTKEKVTIIKDYLLKCQSCGDKGEIITQYTKKCMGYIQNLYPRRNYKLLSFWIDAISGLVKELGASIETLRSHVVNTINYLQNDINKKDNSLDCFVSILKISKEIYIYNSRFMNEIAGLMQPFFERSNDRDVFLKVNNLYFELANQNEKITFSSNVINKFNSVVSWEEKEEIAKTLNSILKAHPNKGVTEDVVRSILNSYTDLIRKSDEEKSEKIISWIKEATKNRDVRKIFSENIGEMIENYNYKFLPIFNEFSTETIDEIKSILATPNRKDKWLVALNILKEMKVVDNKRDVILKLIDDLDTGDFDEEDKELLEEVKEKWRPEDG